MPISPIVLQRRHAELGRIRLGAKNTNRGFPMKLDSFRFTSPSERYINDLAALYGGTPQPWDNAGKNEWEVYTDATSVPVIAVKGGLSQWMETWSGGGCVHRCDGEQQVDGTACDPEEFIIVGKKQERLYVHRDAKPTTRLSVMLPELEAIGVWRMESHGWNAAAEIPAVAELATFVGDLVPAHLHLVERRAVKDGQTSRFVVPVLDLQIGTARLKEIVAQKSGQAHELQASPGPAAIEGGPRVEPPPLTEDVVSQMGLEELREAWTLHTDHTSRGLITARVQKLQPLAEDAAADADANSDVAPTQDGDAIWQQILKTAGDQGMTLDDVTADFSHTMGGLVAADATAGELQAYLDQLRERDTAASTAAEAVSA